MRTSNDDFLTRFALLEEKVRQLQVNQRAYVENVIVGGAFSSSTVVPPFFVPFGGLALAVFGRTLAGTAEINISRNGVGFAFLSITSANTTFSQEEPDLVAPLLEEDDRIQIHISSASGSASGLSVGVIIEP